MSFDNPRLIPEVYQKCDDKTTFYTPAIMGETPSKFWTLKHKEHALKKRLFAPSVSMNFRKAHTLLQASETQYAETIVYLSMKFFRDHEAVVDERIIKLQETFEQEFARTGEVFDFAEWTRCEPSLLFRPNQCAFFPTLSAKFL